MRRKFDVLIVDDDTAQAELMRTLMLELELPHNCCHVSSGRAALDFLDHRPPFENAPRPHIILLDLAMPEMSGCEVLKIVKSDERFRSIPVIMLTNSGAASDVENCYRERANAYIRKPTDLTSNLDVIRELDRFWFATARLDH